MDKVKLTIELSEQASDDLMDIIDLGIDYLNPEYYRAKQINKMYERLLIARRDNKNKISFRYKTVEAPE